MAKDIDGTSGFTGGVYEKPTGIDNGNKYSELIVEFMDRMAVHNHSNKNSLQVALPTRAEEIFTAGVLTFTPRTVDSTTVAYSVTLTTSSINTELKDVAFFAKPTAEPDSPENWDRIYPTWNAHVTNENIIYLDVNRNGIDIKVVG